MRAVEWSTKAEGHLDQWIDYLDRVAGPEVAFRGRTAARAKAASLARFAGHQRSLRWKGYQEASLKPWHKLLIYRVIGDRVEVSALFDMRQDLSRVRL